MRKSPFAIFGLALLFASQSSAGTLGNGAAQRNGVAPAPPVARAHYGYCYGQWPRTSTAYFSAVITSAPSPKNPSFEAPFRSYLHNTFGIGASTVCRDLPSMDAAVGAKKQDEDMFRSGYHSQIVETNWAGAPGAASSLAPPPAASANTPTSPPPSASGTTPPSLPPAAQAIPGAAGAQVNGQIEQAGQNLLNKLFQH
jgi:hypothetical protein